MPIICKACGTENRDDAKFCANCGVPLPQKNRPVPQTRAENFNPGSFWLKVIAILAVVAVAGYFVFRQIDKGQKIEVVNSFLSKYDAQDRASLGAADANDVNVEGLKWNMTTVQIAKLYPFGKPSKDPDFVTSQFITQAMLKDFIPYDNFMSIGIADGKLYGIKFEFTDMEKAKTQEVGIPNSDYIMYGRYKGLLRMFKAMYGDPRQEKSDLPGDDVVAKVQKIKSGESGSSLYTFWIVGNTKAELVLFGLQGQLKFTVRFLYLPVWNLIGKQ